MKKLTVYKNFGIGFNQAMTKFAEGEGDMFAGLGDWWRGLDSRWRDAIMGGIFGLLGGGGLGFMKGSPFGGGLGGLLLGGGLGKLFGRQLWGERFDWPAETPKKPPAG